MLCTDPMVVSDVGGTLAKHVKAGARVVAIILWEYSDDVMRQISEMTSILGIEKRVLGYRRGLC